jgi:hypothetical protein
MSEKRKDEQWCVSPMLSCPNCGEFGDNIYHDNEEENEWGRFRDAHCLNCNYWWCEIIGDGDDDEE